MNIGDKVGEWTVDLVRENSVRLVHPNGSLTTHFTDESLCEACGGPPFRLKSWDGVVVGVETDGQPCARCLPENHMDYIPRPSPT